MLGRRGVVSEMQAIEDFAVHLLEHGFAVEGIHAAAEESEVHVEARAPRSVVGAGLFVVALEVVGYSFNRTAMAARVAGISRASFCGIWGGSG